jgi:hypothetical protein
MRAGRLVWCSLVPAAVLSIGCEPLFGGEGAQSPADEPQAAADPPRSPAGARAALYAGTPQVVEVPAGRGPMVIVVRAPEAGAGPVTVVVVPPRSLTTRPPAQPLYAMPRMLPSPYEDEDEATPRPAYKPSPYEEPKPALYQYD